MESPEFGQAIKAYEKVLEGLEVPNSDIQRQITKIQDPGNPRERLIGFINLTQSLQGKQISKNSK
jgi:hypothetical protein